jgi:hypothetical protein
MRKLVTTVDSDLVTSSNYGSSNSSSNSSKNFKKTNEMSVTKFFKSI